MFDRLPPILAVFVLIVGSQCALAGVVVDGSLNEWGVVVANNNQSNFSSPSSIANAFVAEDQDDLAGDGGFVGPAYGGQNYDAEFLAISFDGLRLSIAIVSGQRPDNGFVRYAPGDIRIDSSVGNFGIEVGGGSGGGSGAAISEGAVGTTYQLNSSGFTTSVSTSAIQTAGSIWKDPVWLFSPPFSHLETQLQFEGGTLVGEADYRFTLNSVTSQHSIIELSIDAAQVFGPGATITGVSWHPSCGNDVLSLTTGFTVTPEPTTLTIWSTLSLSFVGICWLRRRRQRMQA
jgi:hypothetical protein